MTVGIAVMVVGVGGEGGGLLVVVTWWGKGRDDVDSRFVTPVEIETLMTLHNLQIGGYPDVPAAPISSS
jgi:hypothetical protein